MSRIIAIGGGELRKGATRLIDDEIVRASGKDQPNLLFIPTASDDAEGYVESIKQYFGTELGCKVESLYLLNNNTTQEAARKQIEAADIIYVGGGNTKKMIEIWKEYGVDLALQQAYLKGTILSGLSAGSICWFESGSSDSECIEGSDESHYIRLKGLNLIDALHCPHLDEDGRFESLKELIKGSNQVGIGLENCCAIDIKDNTYRILKSKLEAKAYKMYYLVDALYLEELTNSDYESLENLLKKCF